MATNSKTALGGPLVHPDYAGDFANKPHGNHPDYVRVMKDFQETLETGYWTTVADASATAAIGGDVLGGTVVLTSTTLTDNDGASIQATSKIFKTVVGKKLWAEAKLQISDATQMDMFFGLVVDFATNPEDILTAANKIGFQKDDGDASILVKTTAASTTTSTDTTKDMVSATNVTLSMYYDGEGQVKFYVDHNLVATHTTNIPTVTMGPALFELSGDAVGTKSLTCDYVEVVMER